MRVAPHAQPIELTRWCRPAPPAAQRAQGNDRAAVFEAITSSGRRGRGRPAAGFRHSTSPDSARPLTVGQRLPGRPPRPKLRSRRTNYGAPAGIRAAPGTPARAQGRETRCPSAAMRSRAGVSSSRRRKPAAEVRCGPSAQRQAGRLLAAAAGYGGAGGGRSARRRAGLAASGGHSPVRSDLARAARLQQVEQDAARRVAVGRQLQGRQQAAPNGLQLAPTSW